MKRNQKLLSPSIISDHSRFCKPPFTQFPFSFGLPVLIYFYCKLTITCLVIFIRSRPAGWSLLSLSKASSKTFTASSTAAFCRSIAPAAEARASIMFIFSALVRAEAFTLSELSSFEGGSSTETVVTFVFYVV